MCNSLMHLKTYPVGMPQCGDVATGLVTAPMRHRSVDIFGINVIGIQKKKRGGVAR